MIAKTYDRQTAKFLAVVGENMPELSGNVMQGWIQNPRAVQKALRKAFCPPSKVWKTINLGTGLKTVKDFRHALRDGEFGLSDWASDILGKPAFTVDIALTVLIKKTKVDLIKVTVGELGFKKGARRDQIYERAKKLRLELCPPEVGPQLRLQYQDQPNGEWILVAMEPIIDSDGRSRVFSVERHDTEMWLYCVLARPIDFWDANRLWVFCRPCK